MGESIHQRSAKKACQKIIHVLSSFVLSAAELKCLSHRHTVLFMCYALCSTYHLHSAELPGRFHVFALQTHQHQFTSLMGVVMTSSLSLAIFIQKINISSLLCAARDSPIGLSSCCIDWLDDPWDTLPLVLNALLFELIDMFAGRTRFIPPALAGRIRRFSLGISKGRSPKSTDVALPDASTEF